jgi:hypothetical protein
MSRMWDKDRTHDDGAPAPDELKRRAAIEEGKKALAALSAQDRWSYFVHELGYSETDLTQMHLALARAQRIRVVALWVSLVLLPSLVLRWGFPPTCYDLAFCAYMVVRSARSVGFMMQIEDSALWSLAQARARPKFWPRVLYLLP